MDAKGWERVDYTTMLFSHDSLVFAALFNKSNVTAYYKKWAIKEH